MSATHAGSTSGGNLCHLLVRRARNLAMSKSVAAVVVMRFSPTTRAASGGKDQRIYHPATTPAPHHQFELQKTVLAAMRAARDRPMPAWHCGRLHRCGGNDERP